jgi:hypothetical protein
MPSQVRPNVYSDVYSRAVEKALTWCAVRVSNPGPADLSAGSFGCFPLGPAVCRIPLGGNASPISLLPVVAGRFRRIACHLRHISVTWPYSRWQICCRVARRGVDLPADGVFDFAEVVRQLPTKRLPDWARRGQTGQNCFDQHGSRCANNRPTRQTADRVRTGGGRWRRSAVA